MCNSAATVQLTENRLMSGWHLSKGSTRRRQTRVRRPVRRTAHGCRQIRRHPQWWVACLGRLLSDRAQQNAIVTYLASAVELEVRRYAVRIGRRCRLAAALREQRPAARSTCYSADRE